MCKVTRSKENFFDDDVSNNQNHSFFFEEGRFSSLSFFLFFLKFLFFFETIFEISFWAKNQKEIRFLAFFRRRSITSPNVCPRRVSFFFEHSNAKKTRDDLCNNRRSARAQRPGDVSMHRIGSSHPVRRDARRLAFCQTERERRRRRQKRRWGKKDGFIPLLIYKTGPKTTLKKKGEKRKIKDVPMRTTRRWWPR